MAQLNNVGKTFACLIYDLPESTGFDEFFEKCQKVADIVKEKFHLVNDMVSHCCCVYCCQPVCIIQLISAFMYTLLILTCIRHDYMHVYSQKVNIN